MCLQSVQMGSIIHLHDKSAKICVLNVFIYFTDLIFELISTKHFFAYINIWALIGEASGLEQLSASRTLAI